MTTLPTVQELEHSLALAAYVVVRHGEAYVPILERLERELEEARQRVSHTDRARRILAGLSVNVSAGILPPSHPAH